jgi:hypothetical protein
MNFQADLSFGKKWEQTAKTLITLTECVVETAPEGQFKKWDFRTCGGAYEVKADRLAYKYGCKTMFIEHECSGQPSGISSTEADYWVYFMVRPNGEYVAYRIPVEDLKKACVGCPVKSGGDGYRSRGYIVPVLEQFRMLPCSSGQTQQNQTVPVVQSPPQTSPLRIVLPERTLPSGNTTPCSQGQACPRPLSDHHEEESVGISQVES